jgi:hypothetical protein
MLRRKENVVNKTDDVNVHNSFYYNHLHISRLILEPHPLHQASLFYSLSREYYWGKYLCTLDLLFDWFGLVCFANKNKNCQLSHN